MEAELYALLPTTLHTFEKTILHMRTLLTLFTLAILANPIFGQGGKASKAVDSWDQLVRKYVTPGGLVDYAALKDDREFAKTILMFSAQEPNTERWTEEQQLAYWINVYNAFTVKLIVDHMPIESIKDIDDAWKLEFIKLGDNTFSLDQIEHEIIRKQFDEPRVHFALNCASFSCPVLPNRALKAEDLDETLDRLTKDFLNDIHRNRISARKADVSELFEWFAEDFESVGGVRAFIEKHRGKAIDPDLELTYIKYDWRLNGK